MWHRFAPRALHKGLVALPIFVAASLWTAAPRAQAAEVSAFLSGGKPEELWGGGVGGTIGITLFNLVGLEFEGAWQGGQTAASDMWNASGRVYLAPSFKRLVVYGGLSTGLYRQAFRSASDTGSTSGLFLGAKLRLPLAIFLKAEYQWVHLPDEALVKMDGKYLFGAGLSF